MESKAQSETSTFLHPPHNCTFGREVLAYDVQRGCKRIGGSSIAVCGRRVRSGVFCKGGTEEIASCDSAWLLGFWGRGHNLLAEGTWYKKRVPSSVV